jgi:hypothetical protein
MKAYVQKLIGTAVLGLALVSHGIPAWAGYVTQSEVTVATNYAYGSIAGARYSADSQQYISCTLQKSGGPFVWCAARDKAGKYFSCSSTDARYVDAVKGMTDSSYISFSSAPGTTSCNYLEVNIDSAFLR